MAVRGSCFVMGAVSILAFLALAFFLDVASSPFFACRCGRVIFVFAAMEVLEIPFALVGEPLSGYAPLYNAAPFGTSYLFDGMYVPCLMAVCTSAAHQ